MLKRVQLGVQIFFFASFCAVFFFFDFFRSEGHASGLAWYLRLNPFVTLVTSIAARSVVVPAIVLGGVAIVATMLLGRVFCGMVCPLGSIIDFSDRIFKGKPKKNQTLRPPKSLQGLKYVIMGALLLMAAAGVTFPLFMDPLLLVTRLFTLIVRPALFVYAKLVPGLGASELLKDPLAVQGAFTATVATAVLFAAILLGAIFDRRFWCQYVCPSGAFFGLLSRFPLFTRTLNEGKCNHCGICSGIRCPTRAISGEKFDRTSGAECILCGECSADKRSCSSFGFRPPARSRAAPPDITRRHVVSGLFAGLLLPSLVARKSDGRRRSPYSNPIRPPGAVEETAFLARCIACDACVGVCPQHALHPCTLGADGVMLWNTPKLFPRAGYCIEECTRCSEACPTGALLPLTLDEKKSTKIGTAYIHRDRCRPWRQEFKCIICRKKCPYDAIEEKIVTDADGKEWSCPFVNEQKCTGCGACEHVCPVKSEAAIRVYAYGEKRRTVSG